MEEKEVINNLKEAGKTYISLEVEGQESILEESLTIRTLLNDSLQHEKCASGDLNVAELDKLISEACLSVKNKIDDISHLKSNLLESYNSFLKQEKERHDEELKRKVEELHITERSEENYKILVCNKECIIDNLTGALLAEKDKLRTCKAFYVWKNQYRNAQREKFFDALAVRHYTEKLKQKFFSAWRELTEWNWKERIEYKVRQNIRESQKRLVEEYELKIKNVEDELRQSQLKVDTLESNHKFYEDTMRQALLRGVCALNMETMSLFHTTPELNSQPSSPSLTVDKVNFLSEEIGVRQCPECKGNPKVSSEQASKYSTYSKASPSDEASSQRFPKTDYLSQFGYIPMMGTNSVPSHSLKPRNKCVDSEKDYCGHKRSVSVQKHVTKMTSSTPALMKTLKTREQMNRRS